MKLPHLESLHSVACRWRRPLREAKALIAFSGVMSAKGTSKSFAIPGRNISRMGLEGSRRKAVSNLNLASFNDFPNRLVEKGALLERKTFIKAFMRDFTSGHRWIARACLRCILWGKSGQYIAQWQVLVKCCHIKNTWIKEIFQCSYQIEAFTLISIRINKYLHHYVQWF